MKHNQNDELYRLLCEKAVPKELAQEIAYKHMNTDYTATRMLGYLYRISTPRVEDIVDEMLAILSDRDRLIKKHEAEAAQVKINELYQKGLE